jgi:hypothetical protein
VASIRGGRCRACRDFARRNAPGECRSCHRALAVNRHRRCRLCTVVRRDAHLAGDADWQTEPGQLPGIQLFLGDGFSTTPRAARPRAAQPEPDAAVPVIGQLELFSVRPAPEHADSAARAWAASPAGTELLAAVTTFARTRGWPTATTNAVHRAVALTAVTSPDFDTGPAVLAQLRRRYLPVRRLREFLTAAGLGPPAPTAAKPADLVDHVLGDLPAPMAKELTRWVATLTGAHRRARAHASTTIASYLRAVRPAVQQWALEYPSLRQVTDDDVHGHLEALRGSRRTHTAVALRSLFGTLKAHGMIFANPARPARPGKFPHRPVLGLDDATRVGLLARLDRLDHRLVVLLAAVHALSRADIAQLRLDDLDLHARTIVMHGKPRPLDTLTQDHLLAWLRERRRRWPNTANRHLLISTQSALGHDPVSTGYFRALPIAVSQLRADRLLAQARDTDGDALSLMHLFGLSKDAAVEYCAELDHEPSPAANGSTAAPSPPRTARSQ